VSGGKRAGIKARKIQGKRSILWAWGPSPGAGSEAGKKLSRETEKAKGPRPKSARRRRGKEWPVAIREVWRGKNYHLAGEKNAFQLGKCRGGEGKTVCLVKKKKRTAYLIGAVFTERHSTRAHPYLGGRRKTKKRW